VINCIILYPVILFTEMPCGNASTRIPPITDLAVSYLQGMFVLANIAAGNELSKEAVMDVLVPHRADRMKPSFVVKFLQNKDKQLRVATLWCILNLIYPKCEAASGRVVRLQSAGVILQVKNMINDPCLDCKVPP
jgi:armadillo repeat-containing protein 8